MRIESWKLPELIISIGMLLFLPLQATQPLHAENTTTRFISTEERQKFLSNAVLVAILDSNATLIHNLISSGFDPNKKLILADDVVEDYRMDYALHLAAKLGRSKCTIKLLEMGANRHLRDNSLKLAAHYAKNDACGRVLAAADCNYISAVSELLLHFKVARQFADFKQTTFSNCKEKDLARIGIYILREASASSSHPILSLQLNLDIRNPGKQKAFRISTTEGALSGKFAEGRIWYKNGAWHVEVDKFGHS